MTSRSLAGLITIAGVALGAIWLGTRPGEETSRVRVLAIADLHGALESVPDGSDGGRLIGGVAVLKAAMDTAEAQCDCLTLRVDAGDQMQGTLISNLFYGASTVAALNLLGLDVAAIGNHEFDWSVDTLRRRIDEAQYEWLVANVFDSATGRRPEWAGGKEVLLWPSTIAENAMKRWATRAGLLDLETEEIMARRGEPLSILKNESVDTKLFLYDRMCISIHQGRCDGMAPRSFNYERYFVQPDL